ncbi:alpha/beta hydrolase [Candidatus Uhrbacteria bacterium]|nr:alpha/beta hydrolase [Candidatus Uhrbacteria bacterium]
MPFEMNQNERSFDAQYAKREKIETAGGVADVIDITPPNCKSETPVFFANAWACPLEVYRPGLEELYNQGRRVIALDSPRRGGAKFATEEERKAATIRDVLRHKGLSHLQAITHSNGGSNLVKAAHDNPGLFDSVIIVAPSGLIGGDSILQMTGRYMQQFLGRTESMNRRFPTPAKTEKEVPITALKEGTKYVAANPARAAKEIWDISSVQIQDMLKKLHENGVQVVVMSSVDDPLYPMDRMQKMVKSDMITGFVSMVGGHGALGDDPTHFMAAAESQLTALERKQQKNG